MSKNGYTIPEHLRPKPGTLFINSSTCRRNYSRAAALLNMWQKAVDERERAKNEQLSQPG